MKALEFAKLLRKLIREEVTTIVREELKAIKPLLMEKASNNVAKERVIPTQKPKQPQPKRTIPTVSFDGPLADILNETAQSMYKTPQEEEWPDMGGTYTSDQVPAMGFSNENNIGSFDAGDALPSYGSTAAFIKDYSAVMKAADNFKQGNH